MKIPDPILNGSVHQWARVLIAAVRSLRVAPGSGVVVKETANGTVVSAPLRRIDTVYVAGKKWGLADWTGTASAILAIPFDGATAPYYITIAAYEAIDWTTLPVATASSDARNDALIIDLTRTPGPDFYVQRG